MCTRCGAGGLAWRRVGGGLTWGGSVVGEIEGEKKGSVHLPPIMGRDSQPNRSRPNHHHRVFFVLGMEKRDGLCLREKQNHG